MMGFIVTPTIGRRSVGEFGNKFRKARESKNLSLDDVSNVTKISARSLQAIEEEHFNQLPGGVFNKGFIRAYAKHLGLDSDDAVTDYLACLHQAQIDAHEVWESGPSAPAAARPSVPAAPAPTTVAVPTKPAVKPPAAVSVEELPDLQLPRAEHVRGKKKEYLNQPSPGIPWKIVATAVIILIAVIFFWTHHSRNANTIAAKAATPPATAPVPVLASAKPPSTSQAPLPTPPASHPSTPDTTSQAPKPSVARAPALATEPATPAGNVEETVVRKGDVTIRSFGQPVAIPETKSATPFSLVIRATETSWISVTADGKLVTEETLIAPANTTVHGTREIAVRVGNAAGVAFRWNNEELPPQGAEAEVKTVVFDRDGMRALPAQAPQ